MKKTLLLAGVACLFSYNANAMHVSSAMRPYVGLDYAYSHASYKGQASRMADKDMIDDNYNSGIINAGMKFGHYSGIEAFYQQSEEITGDHYYNNGYTYEAKTQFNAYGLDMYGYMPVGCGGFNLLGTAGLGVYDIEIKGAGTKDTWSRVGYRAGLGAQYDFNDNWSARVVGRYSYIGTKAVDNLKEITAGIRYTF